MTEKFIILGDGGHASVCRDVAKKLGYEEIGYVLQKQSGSRESLPHKKYLGDDEWLLKHTKTKPWLVNGIGSESNSIIRANIFNKYTSYGFKFLTLIHPSAQIGENVKLDEGVQIMAGAIVQPNCSIGSNTIINTRASIDHDCVIRSHVHIAPGAVLCGGVFVDEGSFVGAQACIIQGINIGYNAVIGAGLAVRKNVQNKVRFVGK